MAKCKEITDPAENSSMKEVSWPLLLAKYYAGDQIKMRRTGHAARFGEREEWRVLGFAGKS